MIFLLAFPAAPQLTREIFGNVPRGAQAVFYGLALAAVACFAWGIYRRARLWRLGRPAMVRPSFQMAIKRLVRDVLLQRRMGRARWKANRAHLLLVSGFLVLLAGTTLIAVEHFLAFVLGRETSDPVFHKGVYFATYELAMDLAGMALVAGCVIFARRRMKGGGSFARSASDWAVLGLLLAIAISGYLLEGLRILHQQTPMAGFSCVGLGAAWMLQGLGMHQFGAGVWHLLVWWLHAVLALALIAMFPYMRLLHAMAGLLNLLVRDERLGAMTPVSLEEFASTSKIGAGDVWNFTSMQLLELDACVSCGRCEDRCPAWEAGKPLSPRNLLQDIRAHLNSAGTARMRLGKDGDPSRAAPQVASKLHGDTISAETVWSCTSCLACTDICPLGISPVGFIHEMRRFLIAESALSGSPATSLQKTQRCGNPWGLPAEDRFSWAEGLEVPTVESCRDFDILYWIGCAAAYDRRIQKVARSVVRLLKAANVRFAVLGEIERCSGETARRMGDEFLFQELAAANIQSLDRHGVKKIVTHCPHCLHTLKHDYPQMGGHYEVVHHSELLADLIFEDRLKVAPSGTGGVGTVTYHDPCYLARANDISDAPRALINSALRCEENVKLLEMPRRRRDTACCGAGGGRMWFDDAPDRRVGLDRVKEALETGAKTVAVSCPFCMIMMKDGVAAQTADVQVRDVAEILADGIDTTTRTK